MNTRDILRDPKRRADAAQQLFSHPAYGLVPLILDEIELGAVVELRRGDASAEHVAAIRAVELIRQALRLEAENAGVRSDIA